MMVSNGFVEGNVRKCKHLIFNRKRRIEKNDNEQDIETEA